MENKEIIDLCKKRSDLVIEYLTLILDDTNLLGKMNFWYEEKIDHISLLLDIQVKKDDKVSFERKLKLDIPKIHANVFYQNLLEDIYDNFIEHETIGINHFFRIMSMPSIRTEAKSRIGLIDKPFYGITISNQQNNAYIALNFMYTDEKFLEIEKDYNNKLITYANTMEISKKTKS